MPRLFTRKDNFVTSDRSALPDLGPHRGVRSEWWYFTGRLVDQSQEEHFYVLAFFRSSFGIEISHFAHFLLHSLSSGSGIACERSVSPFGGLGRIQQNGLGIDYDGWTASFNGQSFAIRATYNSSALELQLSTGSVLLPGCEGRIDLGTVNTQCRSFPRLRAEGRIKLGRDVREVRGLSWFDHEWGTISFPHRWDWWGINLENGGDLVIRQTRDGGVANLRHSDGRTETTTAICAKAVRHWQNPRGALYPTDWRIELPEFGAQLKITAERDRCETPFPIKYWEGPCRVQARMKGTLANGRGYMELMGYDSSITQFVISRLARLCRDVVFRNRSALDTGSSFPSL